MDDFQRREGQGARLEYHGFNEPVTLHLDESCSCTVLSESFQTLSSFPHFVMFQTPLEINYFFLSIYTQYLTYPTMR